MKNNKGFAITTIVYSILILLSLSMFIVLEVAKNSYENEKEYMNDVNEELNNFLITKEFADNFEYMEEFDYIEPTTNDSFPYHKVTIPKTGYYQIELWGAQGGQGLKNAVLANVPGKGGYTKGLINLIKNEELYIYVGGIGQNATVASGGAGGYNGGGKGGTDTQDNDDSGGGGGATDIRYFSETPSMEDLKWDSTKGLNSRIMVAAGGGGSTYYNNGEAGRVLTGINVASKYGTGGTQTTGAAFGKGGTGVNAIGVGGGGGGSGYYGGFGGPSDSLAGGGGSSFISGYAGVVSVRMVNNSFVQPANLTSEQGYSTLHYSGKYFIDGKMQAGINEGNGVAKITYIGPTEPTRTNTKLNNVKYIKDCINGSSVNIYNSWIEMQVIYKGENIANSRLKMGKIFNSKLLTELSTAKYINIIDGKIDNNYGHPSTNTGNQCMVIELTQEYDIDEMGIWHYWSDNRTFYENVIYVSSDGNTWIPVINEIIPESSNGKRVNAYEEA